MLAKIKQWLGIGGVSVKCVPDSPYIWDRATILCGNVELTSKSDQFVSSVVVKVKEKRVSGTGDKRKEEVFDLGEMEAASDVTIKAGETQTMPYAIAYEIQNTTLDFFANRGGAIGKIGSIAKFAGGQSTTFELSAHAKVKGTIAGSTHKMQLEFRTLN